MRTATPPLPATAQLDAARQFDFWLGEWDVAGDDGGNGASSVYLDLDDRVVVESLDTRPQTEYQRLCHAVYDRRAGRWKQTWVDSDGNYLDFVGGWANGEMELVREAPYDGVVALFRVRWFDVERDGLSWAYERSDDGGESWTPLWTLAYRRVL